jgi:hypothetical protein
MTGSTKALFLALHPLILVVCSCLLSFFFFCPVVFSEGGKNGMTSRALLIHVRCPSRASTSKPTDTYAPAHIGWMPQITRNVRSLVRSDYPTNRPTFGFFGGFFFFLFPTPCRMHNSPGNTKIQKKSHHRKREMLYGELSVTC